MKPLAIFRNLRLLALRITSFLIISSFSTIVLGQSTPDKPLLIIKVESEGVNLTQPNGVGVFTTYELSELSDTLKRNIGTIFTVVPESDKRDCIELGLTVEKLTTRSQVLYLASSAVMVGKGESDLLVTHNVHVQPSLKKIASAIEYQLSMSVLQSQLGSMTK